MRRTGGAGEPEWGEIDLRNKNLVAQSESLYLSLYYTDKGLNYLGGEGISGWRGS